MTSFPLLIGAGLFPKAIWSFQDTERIKLIGAFSDDAGGTGLGSYDVRSNIWHLDCYSTSRRSWSPLSHIWQNSAICKLCLPLAPQSIDHVISEQHAFIRVLLASCYRRTGVLQVL